MKKTCLRFLTGRLLLFWAIMAIGMVCACTDENPAGEEGNEGNGSTEGDNTPTVSDVIVQMNRDVADMQQIAEGKVKVLTCMKESNGRYLVELDNGHVLTVYAEEEQVKKNSVPLVGIDADGYWVCELDGKTENLTTADGQLAAALSSAGKGTFTPQFRVGEKNFWEVSYNGSQWMQIGTRQVWDVEKEPAAAFSPFAGCSADEDAGTLTISLRCGEKKINTQVQGKGTTDAWNKFVAGSADNVLLDFSYAGYKHGEEEAPDGFALGYKTINVKEYMDAHPDLTAREAFLKLLKEKKLVRIDDESKSYSNDNAGVVFYFPAGEYVLHNEEDNTLRQDVENPAYDGKGNNTSSSIIIYGGNFVIKGDGPDKTFIKMDTPNLPTDTEVMYSSLVMINIKHNAWLGAEYEVTGNAGKGTFKVKVAGASNFKVGEWVCLYLHDNSPELVKQELLPYAWESTMTNISTEGVQVEDYHQIVNISGDEITFKEPIMHEVDAQWNWKLRKYSYYDLNSATLL